MERIPRGCVVGLGQPMLDMLVKADENLYTKYGLEKDNAILAQPQHKDLYTEIENNYEVEYTAGGATMNTVKMIQWILRKPYTCGFVGCIASDKAGEILRKDCEKYQMHSCLQITNTDSGTGRCVILIHGVNRSMISYPGAAPELTQQYVQDNAVWTLIKNANVYYVSGFILAANPDTVMEIARFSFAQGKIFCFNLSAPYVATHFAGEIDALLPFVNILFGNKADAIAYGDKHGLKNEPISKIAQHLGSKICAPTREKESIVLLTQTAEPVIMVKSSGLKVQEFPVAPIHKEYIVDTTGAGDAFAAGFIAEYLLTTEPDKAVRKGIKAARYIIQRPGFKLGSRDKYDL